MIRKRIEALRAAMKENGIDVYYLNTLDYHSSEYLPDYFKTIKYFTGFTGSLAQCVITESEVHLFVDGRYHVQAEKECGIHGIIVEKLGTKGVKDSLTYLNDMDTSMVLGFDAKCMSANFVKKLKFKTLVDIDIYSDLFDDRPSLSNDPIYQLDIKYTGLSRKDKMAILKNVLKDKVLLVNNLDAIAYVLNLRANDITYTPVFLSYLIYDGDFHLFVDLNRLEEDLLANLYEDGLVIHSYDKFYDYIKQIKHKTVLYDGDILNYAAYKNISTSNKKINMPLIISDMKAIKNSVEIKASRQAHIYDGVCMLRLMMWLDKQDKESLNEYLVSLKAKELRLNYRAFDLSFNSIVAYNENAAMMHYAPTKENSANLKNEGILLIDSGGQYLEGTTDITRTFALGNVSDEIKYYYTLVLKSLFNLADVKFLKGMCGNQLDILARKDLWAIGVDYRCGTGHGVGHVLGVHENPPNIRYSKGGTSEAPLKVGHIFSDEPGVYFEGRFGIRLENMLLCKEVMTNEYGTFLGFEHLTMCPFDLRLIDTKYLDQKTIDSLNAYHRLVYENLSPYLNDEELAYLKEVTRAI